jgi:hypothetical protein
MMRPDHPPPPAQAASPSPSQHEHLDSLVVLAMTPFFLFPQTWVTLVLMAAIPLRWLFRSHRSGFPLKSTPLHGPLLLLSGLLLVSLGATYDPRLSFPKVSSVYYGVVRCRLR